MRLPPLFGYGFRPFFLAATLAAVLLIPAWVASLELGLPLATAWPATLWHGHEMVFGFIVAHVARSYFGDLKMPGAMPVMVSALLLLVAAVIASWLPAARAARVNVMQALRSE